jgi:hypothetical protein
LKELANSRYFIYTHLTENMTNSLISTHLI